MTTTKKENNLMTPEGYFAEFYDMHDGKTFQTHTWRKLEEKVMRKHGVYKYPTLSSFKMAKSRYMRANGFYKVK